MGDTNLDNGLENPTTSNPPQTTPVVSQAEARLLSEFNAAIDSFKTIISKKLESTITPKGKSRRKSGIEKYKEQLIKEWGKDYQANSAIKNRRNLISQIEALNTALKSEKFTSLTTVKAHLHRLVQVENRRVSLGTHIGFDNQAGEGTPPPKTTTPKILRRSSSSSQRRLVSRQKSEPADRRTPCQELIEELFTIQAQFQQHSILQHTELLEYIARYREHCQTLEQLLPDSEDNNEEPSGLMSGILLDMQVLSRSLQALAATSSLTPTHITEQRKNLFIQLRTVRKAIFEVKAGKDFATTINQLENNKIKTVANSLLLQAQSLYETSHGIRVHDNLVTKIKQLSSMFKTQLANEENALSQLLEETLPIKWELVKRLLGKFVSGSDNEHLQTTIDDTRDTLHALYKEYFQQSHDAATKEQLCQQLDATAQAIELLRQQKTAPDALLTQAVIDLKHHWFSKETSDFQNIIAASDKSSKKLTKEIYATYFSAYMKAENAGDRQALINELKEFTQTLNKQDTLPNEQTAQTLVNHKLFLLNNQLLAFYTKQYGIGTYPYAIIKFYETCLLATENQTQQKEFVKFIATLKKIAVKGSGNDLLTINQLIQALSKQHPKIQTKDSLVIELTNKVIKFYQTCLLEAAEELDITKRQLITSKLNDFITTLQHIATEKPAKNLLRINKLMEELNQQEISIIGKQLLSPASLSVFKQFSIPNFEREIFKQTLDYLTVLQARLRKRLSPMSLKPRSINFELKHAKDIPRRKDENNLLTPDSINMLVNESRALLMLAEGNSHATQKTYRIVTEELRDFTQRCTQELAPTLHTSKRYYLDELALKNKQAEKESFSFIHDEITKTSNVLTELHFNTVIFQLTQLEKISLQQKNNYQNIPNLVLIIDNFSSAITRYREYFSTFYSAYPLDKESLLKDVTKFFRIAKEITADMQTYHNDIATLESKIQQKLPILQQYSLNGLLWKIKKQLDIAPKSLKEYIQHYQAICANHMLRNNNYQDLEERIIAAQAISHKIAQSKRSHDDYVDCSYTLQEEINEIQKTLTPTLIDCIVDIHAVNCPAHLEQDIQRMVTLMVAALKTALNQLAEQNGQRDITQPKMKVINALINIYNDTKNAESTDAKKIRNEFEKLLNYLEDTNATELLHYLLQSTEPLFSDRLNELNNRQQHKQYLEQNPKTLPNLSQEDGNLQQLQDTLKTHDPLVLPTFTNFLEVLRITKLPYIRNSKEIWYADAAAYLSKLLDSRSTRTDYKIMASIEKSANTALLEHFDKFVRKGDNNTPRFYATLKEMMLNSSVSHVFISMNNQALRQALSNTAEHFSRNQSLQAETLNQAFNDLINIIIQETAKHFVNKLESALADPDLHNQKERLSIRLAHVHDNIKSFLINVSLVEKETLFNHLLNFIEHIDTQLPEVITNFCKLNAIFEKENTACAITPYCNSIQTLAMSKVGNACSELLKQLRGTALLVGLPSTDNDIFIDPQAQLTSLQEQLKTPGLVSKNAKALISQTIHTLQEQFFTAQITKLTEDYINPSADNKLKTQATIHLQHFSEKFQAEKDLKRRHKFCELAQKYNQVAKTPTDAILIKQVEQLENTIGRVRILSILLAIFQKVRNLFSNQNTAAAPADANLPIVTVNTQKKPSFFHTIANIQITTDVLQRLRETLFTRVSPKAAATEGNIETPDTPAESCIEENEEDMIKRKCDQVAQYIIQHRTFFYAPFIAQQQFAEWSKTNENARTLHAILLSALPERKQQTEWYALIKGIIAGTQKLAAEPEAEAIKNKRRNILIDATANALTLKNVLQHEASQKPVLALCAYLKERPQLLGALHAHIRHNPQIKDWAEVQSTLFARQNDDHRLTNKGRIANLLATQRKEVVEDRFVSLQSSSAPTPMPKPKSPRRN